MTKNYLTALTDDSAIGARVRQKSEKDVGESCCQTNDVCEVAKRKWSLCSVLEFGAGPRMIVSAKIGY